MSTLSADRRLSGIPQLALFKTTPRSRRADVHAVSIPAGSFTGDFYFTHRYADRLWLAIGDVAGKGLPAALIMAMIHEELEQRITSCAITACDPSATVSRLHTFLRPNMPRNRFASAVIGHLRDDGTLILTNAGHCPALIWRRDGTIDEVGSTGPVLGLLPGGRWGSTTHSLRRGEALLLYTDGAIEAMSKSCEQLGVERLKQIFADVARRDSTARDIATAVAEAVRHHAGGVRDDDLTIVVVRR